MAHNGPTNPYVLVIGAAGIDSKGRAGVPLTLGSSTPGTVRVSVGGTARNVADNLARLGIDTVLMSAIGGGGNGRRILNNAESVGINTDYVLVSEDHHTSAYLAVLDETGSLVMSVDDMEVLSCITPQVINYQRKLIRDAAMVVIDSNLSQATVNSVFKAAQRYSTPVCADPASTTVATRLKPHLRNVYMITPNVREAEVLSGQSIANENDAITAARKLVSAGVGIVIITLAEAGVVYASPSDSGRIPAVTTDIVDFTGASDALTAAVVFGLLNNISLDESVRLGASAAALTLACSDTVCGDLSLDLLYDRLLI